MRERDENGRWKHGEMPMDWRWKRRKLGPDDEAAICEAKRSGANYADLTKQYGVSRQTLWRILCEGGVLDPTAYRARVAERRFLARTNRRRLVESDDQFISEQMIVGLEKLCEEKDARNRALRKVIVVLDHRVRDLEKQLDEYGIVPVTKEANYRFRSLRGR